jgi:hypothetical protein
MGDPKHLLYMFTKPGKSCSKPTWYRNFFSLGPLSISDPDTHLHNFDIRNFGSIKKTEHYKNGLLETNISIACEGNELPSTFVAVVALQHTLIPPHSF